MIRRSALLASALLGLAVAPAAAQTCGPLTFAFATTGPGCAPLGGAVPALSVALVPSPALTVCPLAFTLTPGPSPTPIGVLSSAFLIVGTSNPTLDLGFLGLPGCTLLASLDAIVPMAPASGGSFALTVPLPATPVLIGATAYTQGLLLSPSPTTVFAPKLTDGVSVSIF
ncbi:MAG TPA: hypothetical protein VFI25_00935 [Planctomycetota bacterium]|nr:hypothetical protein [Planctomycetota bacterium]